MAFDFKKEYKEFYMPKNKPEIVTVPKANYIALRGQGDPNEENGAYQQAIGVLYAVAYTLKMSYKTDHKIEGFYEYVVPPLEGFWWQEGTAGVNYSDKSAFHWISVIRLPDFITKADFDWAVETATKKKKLDCSAAEYLSEGLTLKADSFAIKVDSTAVAKENYKIETNPADDCTFEIVFTADFVKSLAESKQIVITYKATLNDKAKISPEGNTNITWLNYSEQETEEKKTELFSFKFDVDKVDGSDKALAGAKFKLYDAKTGGNVIKVVATETAGVYRVAATTETGIEEMETDSNGQLTVLGLDKKTYYLEETVAPAGYNKLTARQEVNLSNGNVLRGETEGNKTYGVKITNQAGTELPSTGGIGTTIFYVLGSILVIGAAVLLITKKRMGNNT